MKELDQYLHDFLRSPEFKKILDEELDFTSPITLTYALERLIITHVKLFQMEDQVRNPNLVDSEIGNIKRRIDYWNSIVRPRLVEAIGDILAKAVKDADLELAREPNFKKYGFDV